LLANETAEICTHKIPYVLTMDQAYKHTLAYTSETLNTNRKVTKNENLEENQFAEKKPIKIGRKI